MKKELKIEIPNGYEIDRENSTFENIVFKEVEKTLEVGKWYKYKNSKTALVFINKPLLNNATIGFGINGSGGWTDNFHYYENDKHRLFEATHEEVETALIKEAEKKGFKEGVKYHYPYKPYIPQRIIEAVFKFHKEDNTLTNNNCILFKDGIWVAEIIEEPKLPSKWDDSLYNRKNPQYRKAKKAQHKLLVLRDIYRDSWLPEYGKNRYAIIVLNDNIQIETLNIFENLLSFQNKETAELFLNNFRDLIEEFKPLMK